MYQCIRDGEADNFRVAVETIMGRAELLNTRLVVPLTYCVHRAPTSRAAHGYRERRWEVVKRGQDFCQGRQQGKVLHEDSRWQADLFSISEAGRLSEQELQVCACVPQMPWRSWLAPLSPAEAFRYRGGRGALTQEDDKNAVSPTAEQSSSAEFHTQLLRAFCFCRT